MSVKRQIIAGVATAGIMMAVGVVSGGTVQASGFPAGEDNSSWVLSTSSFTNQSETEPYVGNGYLSQRIPAAGMGFLAGPRPAGSGHSLATRYSPTGRARTWASFRCG